MPAPHILIVAVDGLRASALGAYGNTAYPTPAIDAFAAESFLLDYSYAPSADLADCYRALWQSIHPARPQTARVNAPALPQQFSARGYSTTLVTDAPEVASLAAASQFDQCAKLAVSGSEVLTRAEDAANTSLAGVFAAACDAVASAASGLPSLVWVHARGMYGPWDAPLVLQLSLLDEDDPPPVASVEPPDVTLSERDDPDTIFRFSCAYAAQVMTLDSCWTGLLDAVRSRGPEREWLVMLLGVRGYPLGEHRQIGGIDRRLFAEQLHVPWLIRLPDGIGQLVRSNRLTSPLDLLPTLLEWIGSERLEFDGTNTLHLLGKAQPTWREALVAAGGGRHRSIRTADWCLRQDEADDQGELYVRPDDRWEANDVAKLCPDEFDQLAREMNEFLRNLDGPAR